MITEAQILTALQNVHDPEIPTLSVVELGLGEVRVTVTYDPPWNSNRITEEGRRKLKEFGFAPPAPYTGELNLIQIEDSACPFCDSHNTILESAFGPTLCRAIHYCNDCRQSFEQFKPV